ncbi:unnamed protein product [Ambrosiozyma monospora]|uniref:Unnamed protein product n=1 Tax=Ambrosiozyma monospora TaxID=43982 RepID=A0A9W6Z1G5_AMBMO|nr:unnamed protein product [Ambrosiozyma monospora]
MVHINPAQIYDMLNEMSEEDYSESITALFVYFSSYRFDYEQQTAYTLESMGKFCDIQALDTIECFNLQLMVTVKTPTPKIPNENPFKTNEFYIDQVSLSDQLLLNG